MTNANELRKNTEWLNEAAFMGASEELAMVEENIEWLNEAAFNEAELAIHGIETMLAYGENVNDAIDAIDAYFDVELDAELEDVIASFDANFGSDYLEAY